MEDQQPEGKGPPDTRPYLCLPYWTAPLEAEDHWDDGSHRPLPPGVVSWLCDAVHPGPYTPGERLEVSVDVRNSGGGSSSSIALVRVYWADPTVGFAKPNFLAATSVAVPASPTAPDSTRSPTVHGVIPASAPPHVCLLVAVSHPQDPAGTVCDPVGDRHWAQRNLVAEVAAPGAPALIPVVVANPLDDEALLLLRVGPAGWDGAARAAAELGTEPGDVPVLVHLLDDDGTQVGQGAEVSTEWVLGPREQRRVQLLVEVDSDLAPGTSVALEAELIAASLERVVGSLGIALRAP